jgi:FixJ family two-component response regulator
VKLPDMSGFDLMMRLQPMVQPVPMILSQEFGWDAGHTVVKCRKAGLHPSGTVIKPFKEKQLLDTLETIIDWSQKQADEAVGQVQPACSASSATPARHAGSGEARAAQAAPDPHGSVP